MAVTIVATVGSASANSYATLAEAETYCEARLNVTLWDAATDDNKNRALVEATRELDVLGWDGYRTDDVQALAWPREWVVNPDDPNLDYYDNDEIPQRVKDSTCELALQFIKSGTTDLAAIPAETNIKRKKIDVLETEYFGPQNTPTGIDRFPRVLARVAPLLASAGMSLGVIRG